MKNKIDLSKIPVKKTPTKWIEANFEGAPKKYEIRALNDGEKSNLLSLLPVGKGENAFRTKNIYVCLLSSGLEIAPEVAEMLFDNCNAEAVRVGEEIFTLSGIFDEAKTAEAEEAEKNSAPETAPKA